MVRRMCWALVAVTAIAAPDVSQPNLSAQARAADLFYNYYVPSGGAGGAAAAMYPCPRPTPPLVGHTYVTYQPLMPHEFLHQHHRNYWRFHPDGRCTRTVVTWQNTFFDPRTWLRPPKVVNQLPWCRKWQPW